MKTYIGCKVIKAMEMTKEEFNTPRCKTMSSSDFITEGYLVQYEDGYKSWSPKEVFEEAYRELNIHFVNGDI